MRVLLKEYPFSFSESSVSILDGTKEGAFQWLTLNYLLGTLSKGVKARRDRDLLRCAASRRQSEAHALSLAGDGCCH